MLHGTVKARKTVMKWETDSKNLAIISMQLFENHFLGKSFGFVFDDLHCFSNILYHDFIENHSLAAKFMCFESRIAWLMDIIF